MKVVLAQSHISLAILFSLSCLTAGDVVPLKQSYLSFKMINSQIRTEREEHSKTGIRFVEKLGTLAGKNIGADPNKNELCPKTHGVTCSGRGICRDGFCSCEAGYIGVDCNIDANEQIFFNIDCNKLDDVYTSLAIRSTTVGACPQYRLAWNLLAYRTCEAMKGQSCEVNQRREYCMRLPECPDLCQRYFDIACANYYIGEMSRAGKRKRKGSNVTVGSNNNNSSFQRYSWRGDKIGRIGQKVGWGTRPNNLLNLFFGKRQVVVKGGL
jgi:hypothetical protein